MKPKKRKSTKKCYVIISDQTGYRHGAFPLTGKGYKLALAYAKRLTKESESKEGFAVKEL